MEHHLETHGAQLTPREREMLEALRDSWPGVFESRSHEEGRGVHLRDLATGDTIFVHDITASRELVRGDWILSRIEDLDGKLMFVSDGFTVPPAVRGEFLKLFDKEAVPPAKPGWNTCAAAATGSTVRSATSATSG